jgi:hypothetical protein
MASMDPDVIRCLVADLEALILQAKLLPDATRAAGARAAVDELRATLPADVGGLAAGTWSTLTEEEQNSVFEKFEAVQKELKIQVSSPGFRGSRMLMSGDPTPTWVVLLLLVAALLGTAFVLWSIVDRWNEAVQGPGSLAQRSSAFALAKDLAEQATRDLQRLQTAQSEAERALQKLKAQPDKAADMAAATAQFEASKNEAEAASGLAQKRWTAAIAAENQLAPPQRTVIVMVILLGALGGLIHLSSSLTMFVGNRDLKRSWTIYYVLAPVQGAALAPLLYLLLKSAVLSPQFSEGGGTQSLNLTAIYAFAGLTGLFAKQAIEKLADVFATLFAKIEAKDATKGGANPRK